MIWLLLAIIKNDISEKKFKKAASSTNDFMTWIFSGVNFSVF